MHPNDRIRKGKSALASDLLPGSHLILDVLFGSPEIGDLIAKSAEGVAQPYGALPKWQVH